MSGGDNDFATGKRVNLSKPEEAVRQEYERVLVEAYAYPKPCIDIEVSIPRGSGKFPDRADIVVYKSTSGRDPAADILGIIEVKRKERKDGLAQLKSYLTATSASWGVWTNGDDIAYVCKPPGESSVSEVYLNNVPAYGQSISDVGRIQRKDLRPFGRQELKGAFRRILRTLYANTSISRKEKLGNEMIKLIFAKLEDEQSYQSRSVPDFRAEAGEDARHVKKRIDNLFKRVLEELKNDGVFEDHEKITLDANSVAWVVGQLERNSLLKTDTDVVGDAFEIFAESKLVGEKGEFFTPRGVIQLAVKIANPRPRQTICDPACGSGGFLIHAMKHLWSMMEQDPEWKDSPRLPDNKKRMAAGSIFGIDKESDLVKIAKAYMAISGDGRSNIVHENSLHDAAAFEPAAKHIFIREDAFREFDFVLTNPPYGSRTKVKKSNSKNFELGRQWNFNDKSGEWVTGKTCERDPYVLFVERCFDMLKENGTLAIVLPETVFHAPTTRYLRRFIASRGSIVAIIGLPHNTFRPHCNAKTSLLVIQKGARQSKDVIMASPEEMGHDHQGKPIYRPGSQELWDDLPIVMKEIDAPGAKGNQFTFLVPWSKIEKRGNWVPSYYKGLTKLPRTAKDQVKVMLGDLVSEGILSAWDGHGSPPSEAKGLGNIPYIRVADIVNWELYRNPVSGITRETYERMIKNKAKPQAEDIIFVRRGSYRIGTVAMASPRDSEVLLTRELLTLRILDRKNSFGITPYYLLALLSSGFVQKQVPAMVFVDTTLPNIGDRWRDLILPVHKDPEKVAEISRSIKSAIEKKWKAQEHIMELRASLGDITT